MTCSAPQKCAEPFPYVWRSDQAPLDLIVIVLLIVLVFAAWCVLRKESE